MKRVYIIILLLAFIPAIQAQHARKAIRNSALKDVSMKRPVSHVVDNPVHFLSSTPNSTVKSANAVSEATLGTTKYDLMTNQMIQNRIYQFADGTISAVWTMGFDDVGGYPDRGTGYNYYDGSVWGPEPTQRIESVKTGWPSIFPLGAGGEGVIAHDFGTPGGLVFSKRATKGAGAWTSSYLPAVTGQNGLSWPRAMANGMDNNNVHVIAITRPTGNQGTIYQGLNGALLYSRSTDGGNTWDIQNQLLSGMTSGEYTGLPADGYAWANPKGNTIAFVVGDMFVDAFLMKSTDNGTTWQKQMIFQHPYPFFDEAHDLILDTPTVVDGSMAVALDVNGKAHVFFGIMRINNDDTTDQEYSYWPYTDGLVYWNEDMPAFTNLNADTLWDQGHLVGWVQDLNGNDTIFEFVDTQDPDGPFGKYFISLTGMPTIHIDDQNRFFLFFTSVNEGADNDNQNYRRIWHRKSFDGGATWTDFVDVTGSLIHNFDECIYPNASFTSDAEYVHLTYMKDDEPGINIQGDEDPVTTNFIQYMKVPKTSAGIPDPGNPAAFVSQNFPNPFSGNTSFQVNMLWPAPLGYQVFDMVGKRVIEMQPVQAGVGNHTFIIDGSRLSPGIYTLSVRAGNQNFTRKMVLR